MKVNLELLTDDELITSLKALVGDERRIVASVLRHLSEFDRRRLAAGRGFPSLFEYCVRELKYAQGEAARRIQSARAAAKYPVLYKAVERGFISLTVASILAPHLKWDNYRRLIRESKGLSTREVEALVASLAPVPAAPAERVRFLAVAAAPPAAPPEEPGLFAPSPERMPTAEAARTIESRPAPVQAVPAPGPVEPAPSVVRRVQFSFTGEEALFWDVERVKELSRRKWPEGKLEEVFAGAIKALLEKIDPDRRGRRKARVRRLLAGARSRHIPVAVKDEVWERDGGRCVYASPGGRVCGARAGLEFDHVRPWALGGGSGDAANVRLLCRTHNDLEARRAFGGALVDGAVARRRDGLRNGAKI